MTIFCIFAYLIRLYKISVSLKNNYNDTIFLFRIFSKIVEYLKQL